ncbi:peptide chain release factor N(5)-glutamine methyltransferase [Rhizobium sp. TH2]|uniref:peptide chain release factor N(5)-glutamine methyltransferase n=1 Tax=Rhizobium sp. TH2 TaxID=2775403 RepID=UPI00215887B5|nr:peptide chain release factor N(5)-glutamine methyltransferase [Rhizobium sp. TH2]UVC08272.1 peptide chain release factor N(5)-glutamine methyltransferase [Rhizobium sp. TH2]
MTTLNEMMAHIRNCFLVAGSEDPMAEARIIVGGLLRLERSDFITRGEEHLALEDEARIHEAVGRRTRGEPPYRILGSRPFYGLELKLSKGTLEPRPDTEILVETVLDLVKHKRQQPLQILDLGTGTGAICLALLAELPNAVGTGADLSADALATACENAAINGLAARFTAIESRWFGNISGRYDVIVSNPPYIRSSVIPTLDRMVREHDPLLALDGGEDGLDAYRDIAAGARPFLNAGGIIAVETGFDQREDVGKVFENEGFLRLKAVKDYAGNDRVQAFSAKN